MSNMRDGIDSGKYEQQKPPRKRRDADLALARLVKRELGVELDPPALRGFLVKKFQLVSALAHQIHDEAEAAR